VPRGAEAPEIGTVDQLKYQELAKREVTDSAEWMTLKLRYKKPDGNKSSLLELSVMSDPVDWRTASPDFLFAAGVALFGEKLRRSDKTGAATWAQVRELARRGAGVDRHGHRAEFQELVGLASRAVPDRAPTQPAPDAVEAPPAE
jgi:Ca-activated chloride channel family protein